MCLLLTATEVAPWRHKVTEANMSDSEMTWTKGMHELHNTVMNAIQQDTLMQDNLKVLPNIHLPSVNAEQNVTMDSWQS